MRTSPALARRLAEKHAATILPDTGLPLRKTLVPYLPDRMRRAGGCEYFAHSPLAAGLPIPAAVDRTGDGVGVFDRAPA